MSDAEIDTADALRGAVRARSIARREALYDEALGGGGGVTWLILTLSAILFTSMATYRAGVALLLPVVPLCLLVADLLRRLSRQQTAVVHLLRELRAGPDPLDEAREPRRAAEPAARPVGAASRARSAAGGCRHSPIEPRKMSIEIVHADITTLEVDAIVNAANPSLGGGGGVDGAIHRAAGPELAAAATRLGPIAHGEAVITPGFRLRAGFVIHAVGPVWHGGGGGEAATLRRTYERAFDLAAARDEIRSIAFPAISSGVYGFPKELAAEIAVAVMRERGGDFERIVACLFDEENVAAYTEQLGSA